MNFIKKLVKFFISFLLVYFFFQIPLGGIVEYLADHGKIGINGDFDYSQIVWGDPYHLLNWLDCFKTFFVVLTSALFGFLYMCFVPRAALFEKILVGVFFSIFVIFGSIILLLLQTYLRDQGRFFEILGLLKGVIVSDLQVLFFWFFLLVASFSSSFFTMEWVAKRLVGEESLFYDPVNKKLFGVKWFHFIWISTAVSVYSKIVYLTIFNTGAQALILLSKIEWFEFLGIYKNENRGMTSWGLSDPSRGLGDEGASHIDQITYHLFGSLGLIFLVLLVLNLLRALLADEMKMKAVYRVLLIIFIGFFVPFGLVFYFPVLSLDRESVQQKLNDSPVAQNNKESNELKPNLTDKR